MMKYIIPLVLVIIILITATVVIIRNRNDQSASEQNSQIETTATPVSENTLSPSATALPIASSPITFSNPKKSAHYVSNTPTHGAILTAVPGEVSIIFNFDLASNSTIQVINGGTDYSVGAATISNDRLKLSKSINPSAPAGLYTVNYKACWPDTSCHDGSFQFAVN